MNFFGPEKITFRARNRLPSKRAKAITLRPELTKTLPFFAATPKAPLTVPGIFTAFLDPGLTTKRPPLNGPSVAPATKALRPEKATWVGTGTPVAKRWTLAPFAAFGNGGGPAA